MHTWDDDCGGPSSIPGFVPILRSHEYETAADLQDGPFTAILGFNEPNHRGQDDRSPEWVAGEWVQIQQRFPDKVSDLNIR